MKVRKISSMVLGMIILISCLAISYNNNEIKDNSKKKGWLGVYIQDVDKKLVKKLNLKVDEGALVTEVVEKSPADSAGIKENDVITEINGRQINDIDDLLKIVNKHKPGEKINIVIMRKEEKKTIPVVLGKNPSEHRLSSIFRGTSGFIPFSILAGHGKFGIQVMTLNEQLGDYFGAPEGKGLLVQKVEKDSPAEKGGIKAGDVILKVNKESITDIKDIWKALSESEEGDKVEVEVIRKGVNKTLTVEIEEGINEGHYNIQFDSDSYNKAFQYYLNDEKLNKIIKINADKIKIEMDKIKPQLDKYKIEMDKIKPQLDKYKKEMKEAVRKSNWSIRVMSI